MTISNTNRTAGPFTGNGVTKQFPFSFKVFTRSDLLVAKTATSTGVETTLLLDADYTVTLNPSQNTNPGGVITLMTALPAGMTLAATSNLPIQQGLDLTNNGGFYPAAINDALDRIVITIQQLSARVGLGALNIGAAATIASVLNFISNIATSAGAALIGFIQSGVGATPMTAQDALRERVTVRQFGGKFDNITDISDAANRAILKLALDGGGTLCFGRGTAKALKPILLVSNVTIDLTGCILNGGGKGTNDIIHAGALVDGALIDITPEYGTSTTGSGTHRVTGASVFGGTLDNGNIGILGQRLNNGTSIVGVTFGANLTNSWITAHSWGLEVRDNTPFSPAIMKDFVDWTRITGNTFEGPGSSANTAALIITTGGYGGSYSAAIASNGFHHWTYGVQYLCETDNSVIESNHFEDVKYPVSSGTLTCRNFRIQNNWMKANLIPSGGGVIAIAFKALRDSQIGPNIYTSDGASTFDAYVSASTGDCFGNKITLPYSPSGALDLSMYQTNDCTTIELRGGTNDLTQTQPTIQTVTGSGYSVVEYKKNYHSLPNTIPGCVVTYSGTTATIDTFIASDAQGVSKFCMFDFFCPGGFTWILSGVFNRLNPTLLVGVEKYAGSAFTGAITLTNNSGFLRITIAGLSAGGSITGWVKEL